MKLDTVRQQFDATRFGLRDTPKRFAIRTPWNRSMGTRLGLGGGSRWLYITVLVQAVSAYTNFAGLNSIFTFVIAAALAIGLQAMVAVIGFKLAGAGTREASRRLFVAWFLVALVSVTFSYTAVDAAFHQRLTLLNAPLKTKDDIRAAAQTLSDAVTTARGLALQNLSNNRSYALANIATAEARLKNGTYYHVPADGEVGLERSQREKDNYEQQIAAWQALNIDTARILQQNPDVAWATLQHIHQQFSNLWGQVPFGENAPTIVVRYPTPAVTGDAGGVQDELSDAFLGPLTRLLHPSGVQLFFLLLAIILEVAPISLAWCGATRDDESAPITQATRGTAGDGRPGVEPVTDGIALPLYDSHDLRLNEYGVRLRRPYKIAESGADWCAVDSLVQPSIDAARRAAVSSLDNLSLQAWLDSAIERIQLYQNAAERIGIPTARLDALVEGAWNQFEAEVKYQSTLVEGDRIGRQMRFYARMLKDLDELESGDLAALGPEGLSSLRKQIDALACPMPQQER